MNNNENNNTESFKKFFVLVYPYILFIGVAVGLFYITKMNNVALSTVPPPLPDSTQQTADYQLKEPSKTTAADMNSLVKASSSLIDKGKSIFQSTCSTCHGANGKGDGPASGALKPSPRNFTSMDNWINGPSLSGIFTTLSEGISGSAMASYDQFTPTEKFALAHYIRSTFVPNPPSPDEEKLAMLDQKFEISTGKETAGQIPLEDAMMIVENEAAVKEKYLVDILNKIKDSNMEDGAVIFKKITNNELNALTELSRNTDWKLNENSFVSMIVNNVNEDGFNSRVFELSNSQWNSLYNFIGKYF